MGPKAFFFFAFALFVSGICAAVIPDKTGILNQLKKNGACCTALSYFLPNKVYLFTDLQYQSSILSYWSAQAKTPNPKCIVIPTSTQDVSTAVTILSVGNQIGISSCKFAVRSGGHTPHAGAANINDGVTIDLQSMNQVTISSDRKTVGIGPGNRWGDVYPTLDNEGLSMVGGRASTVGVGGLVTGGGISYFSGRYGFACDNIQTFEVVLANGTVTTASATRNPTLYRALKGGSNNFGIVTRFDATIFSQSPFWGGSIIQPITNKNAFYEYFSNFTSSKNYDPNSALLTSFSFAAGIVDIPIISQVAYTDGSATWPPPVFQELDSMLKISSTVRKDELTSFTNELATTTSITNGKNNVFMTLTFINKLDKTPELMAEVYKLAEIASAELITVVGITFSFTFQPLPYAIYSKSAATGGNVLGLDRFKDDFINLLFTISWVLPTDNPRVEARVKVLENDIRELTKQKGLFNEFVYLNYAAAWQDPIKGYGAQNGEFLRSVARRYDPQGLFQRGVPGGFKVGA